MYKLKEMFPDLCDKILQKAMKQSDMNHAVDVIIAAESHDDIDDDILLNTGVNDCASMDPDERFSDFLKEKRASEHVQTLDIKRDGVLLQCIRLLKQKRLNLTAVPDVRFANEEGIDAEGLTREFLTCLTTAIKEGEGSMVIFEGEYPHLVPCHNTDVLASRIFFYIGQLMAYSITHAGIAVTGISPTVAPFIISGNIENACNSMSLKDVADLELRETINKIIRIQDEEELQRFAVDGEIAGLLANSGFPDLLTLHNKDRAIQYLMINDIIWKRKAAIDQIEQGLNDPFGLASFMERNEDIPLKHLFPMPRDVHFSPVELCRKLHAAEPMNEQEETAFQWFKDFIENTPQTGNGDDHGVDLRKILQFITGGSLLPAAKINVYFDNSKPLPDADCCFKKIVLPSGHSSYDTFRKALSGAISCQYQGTGRM